MMFYTEQLIWFIVLVGAVGMPGLTVAVLHRAAVADGLGQRAAARLTAVAGAALAGWLVAAVLLVSAGAFRQSSSEVRPWVGVAVLVGVGVLLLATRIPVLARITRDPRRLAWPQTVRVGGVVFLIAWAAGELPAVFALPAGLGDLAIGITALLLARRGTGPSAGRLRAFHVLGMLDLIVAVGIGYLAGRGPDPFIDVAPTTEAVTRLPLVLIPLVLVPLALALHIRALLGLRAMVPKTAARTDPHWARSEPRSTRRRS
jgi:hypothetical protein